MLENKYYDIGDSNIKIALISDIHFDVGYDQLILTKILENLRKNKPNYICIAGDIIDNSNLIHNKIVMEQLKEFIKELSLIASTIVSLGNHDITYIKNSGNIIDINKWFMTLNTIENVYYLYNKSLVRGNLCFTSYNPPYQYYKKKENVKIFINDIDKKILMNKKYYNILLCHSPISVFKNECLNKSKEIKKANLILSGHMHNGLVFKIFDHKGNRGLISPYKRLFPKYARGIVEHSLDDKKITLIISGGVLKFSNTAPKIFKHFNKLFPISIEYINI